MYVSPNNSGQVFVDGVPVASGHSLSLSSNSEVSVSARANDGYKFAFWKGDLTSNNSSEKLIMSCDKVITAYFVSESPIVTTPIYYQHIACSGGWESSICLINRSTVNLSGIFYAYNEQGELVDSRSQITLTPGSRIQFKVSQGFTNAGDISYIIFAAETDSIADVIGYTKFFIRDHYRAAIPAAGRVSQGDIFVTHIAVDDYWWTGINLLNVTDEQKTLTFQFDNGLQRTVTLSPKEHKAINLATLLGDSASAVHSVIIHGAEGIVGLELFGSDNQLSGNLINDQTSREIYYPHVAADDFWWTGVGFYNADVKTNELTFTTYSSGGETLGDPTTVSLEGHKQLVRSVAALNFHPDTAWFKVESKYPIASFELFGTANGLQLAGYSGVDIGSRDGVLPELESNGYTGIAMVNVSADLATITFTAYRNDGSVVTTQSISLAAKAKIVKKAQDLFDEDISGSTYIGYHSTRELVAFQLNGNSDGMMLDALPALH